MKILNETELKEVGGGTGTGTTQQNALGGLSNIWEGANGYAYRDANGGWHYRITKTPWQATTDVIVNGWADAAAGGFGL